MSQRKKFFLLCLSLFILKHNQLSAQITADTTHVFTLGEVTVTGYRTQPSNNRTGAEKNFAYNRMDVSHSLNLLPGTTLSVVGPRNESGVFVHGFDLRQVPIYMDGIPVYVPYDGYVDLGRFTTFDISEIQVSKGYSSVLYGPNAIGGAINLISRKPVKAFEANAVAGWMSGGYLLSTNIGSGMDKFYWQVSASQLKKDYFPLSESFDTTKRENGDKRDNSYSEDIKASAKFGFTPKAGQEYVIGYAYQHGKKGTPVYTGSDTLNSLYKNARYWKWPNWDKQSIYLITNNIIDSNNYVRSRIYYDQFKNTLKSYDDVTYSTITKPYAFTSIYNDYSIGGNIEYGNSSFRNNKLSVAFHFKQDVHREHNEGEPVRTISDNNITGALEDVYHLASKFILSGGFSYMARNSLDAEGYNNTTKKIFDFGNNDNTAWNLQGGVMYNFNTQSSLNISVARKTRFATMKDRYSYRLGTAIPNPDLISESAVNYNLEYTRYNNQKFFIQAAAFYSHINNTIQTVSNVQFDTITNRYLSQLQNTGESEFYGAEAGVEYRAIKQLLFTANYSYIIRHNLTNKNIRFTDVPTNKAFLSAQYMPLTKLYVLASTEYNSKRYSSSYGTISGRFILVNAKAHYNFYKYFSIESGINNLFDKNYTLAEGYPEAGRNYFVNFIFNY